MQGAEITRLDSIKAHPVVAVWTRFNPNTIAIQKAVFDGTIGDVHCVYSDFSTRAIVSQPDTHRALAAELAGGPLLDLGPYPLVWVSLVQPPQ
jgi:dihydrodiol dehydrogenase / D-xylose 1-dehydrogenase (NADP)